MRLADGEWEVTASRDEFGIQVALKGVNGRCLTTHMFEKAWSLMPRGTAEDTASRLIACEVPLDREILANAIYREALESEPAPSPSPRENTESVLEGKS